MKRRSRSKTYWWGHAQVFAGMVVTALGYVTPTYFKDLPFWVYGVAAIAGGVITYILRELTKEAVSK